MSTLIITRGLPGAGKTTWAKAWVAKDPITRARVNRDDLRDMLYGARTGLSFEQEGKVTVASHTATRSLLTAGLDVVADDTNLRPKYVREWRKLAIEVGAAFQTVEVTGPVEEIIAQDAQRERPVGADVITRLAQRFTRNGELLPVPDETEPDALRPYEPRPGARDAVIVDIDGTLALMGERSPYDLTRVHEDTPVESIVRLVDILRETHKVIFLSGREDTARNATEAWLRKHVDKHPTWEPLFMRPEGDRRRDSIVKAELFDRHVRDYYNVRMVLDDRNQVVEMWRSLGLTCLQVADGAF